MGYYGAMKKAERESFNQDLKAAAFTAWRFEIALSGLLGGQAKLSYTDYCEKMGLLTDQEIKRNQALKKLKKLHNKQVVEAAQKRVDDIIAADKARMARERAAKEGG